MNKLMEPYWQEALDWRGLALPLELETQIAQKIAQLDSSEEEHFHLRDFGIFKDYLSFGLRAVESLFERFRKFERSAPLVAYISLDDGSLMDEETSEEDLEFWFDCAVHFHLKGDCKSNFMQNNIDECMQPVLIIDSNDAIFQT